MENRVIDLLRKFTKEPIHKYITITHKKIRIREI